MTERHGYPCPPSTSTFAAIDMTADRVRIGTPRLFATRPGGRYFTYRSGETTLTEISFDEIDLSQPMFFLPALPPDPPKPRTPAAGRTRRARWRAGTRRTRRLAHRPGPSPAPAGDPWGLAGWTDLGWISEEGVSTPAA